MRVLSPFSTTDFAKTGRNIPDLPELRRCALSMCGRAWPFSAGKADTTGFRYETLTDNPLVKKAVDDIVLDFAGEENPKRVCDYGLTEKGMQILRDAADPSLPHTYAWFVLMECNTAQEQFFGELTLEEAIQLYRHSDTQEKRLGVTKDSIATVDIVHMVDGEQRFFPDYQKLESFKSDPVIYEAVDQLYQELVQSSSAQNMNMRGM